MFVSEFLKCQNIMNVTWPFVFHSEYKSWDFFSPMTELWDDPNISYFCVCLEILLHVNGTGAPP